MNDPIYDFAKSDLLKSVLEEVERLTQAFSSNSTHAHLMAIKTGASNLMLSYLPEVVEPEAPEGVEEEKPEQPDTEGVEPEVPPSD